MLTPSLPPLTHPSLIYTIQNMIRIDMSEFMEKHTVSRLVGAPRK